MVALQQHLQHRGGPAEVAVDLEFARSLLNPASRLGLTVCSELRFQHRKRGVAIVQAGVNDSPGRPTSNCPWSWPRAASNALRSAAANSGVPRGVICALQTAPHSRQTLHRDRRMAFPVLLPFLQLAGGRADSNRRQALERVFEIRAQSLASVFSDAAGGDAVFKKLADHHHAGGRPGTKRGNLAIRPAVFLLEGNDPGR